MMNYKQLLTYWSSIAYHHEQIKSFGFGDITQCTNDLTTNQEPQYTRMYIVPEEVEFSENQIHYNFNVIIMDKIEDDDLYKVVMEVLSPFNLFGFASIKRHKLSLTPSLSETLLLLLMLLRLVVVWRHNSVRD